MVDGAIGITMSTRNNQLTISAYCSYCNGWVDLTGETIEELYDSWRGHSEN